MMKYGMSITICLLLIKIVLAYKYRLTSYTSGSSPNIDTGGPSPQIKQGYKGTAAGVSVVRQGTMILPGQILSLNGTALSFGTTETLCFTVFVFNVAQTGTLFTYTSSGTDNSYVVLLLNNGGIRIVSGDWNGSNLVPLPTRDTSSTSLYKTGWNLICFTLSSASFNVYTYPHFDSSPLSEVLASTAYRYFSSYSANFGSTVSNSSLTFSNSLQGIFHTIYIQSSVLTTTQMESANLVPTFTPAYLCDYFIAMFNDLGTQDASNAFTNLMSNYNSQSVLFSNSLSSSLDATNGLSMSVGDIQTISNIKTTTQRAIGIQFWYKGTFSDGSQIVSLSKDSINKSVYLSRYGSDILLKSTYSNLVVPFSSTASSMDSSGWIMIGLSAGWMAKNNDFMICGYIYQSSSSYEYGDCASTMTISSTDFGSGTLLYAELGSGLTGYVKELYVTNHLEHSHIFQWFKNTFGSYRYYCFDTQFNTNPHYFSSGCGNGYVLPTETTETCDDSNTSNSDGCSSSCTIETGYGCVLHTGVAGSCKCSNSCGNGIYEPTFGEQCDDGNTSANDGCLSTCLVESGWDCSTSVAGSKSICTGICGDSKRVSSEGCDDGNKNDGVGCKADCSGAMNGWHCSGGTTTSKDTCTEQCNDGYITVSEQCEDGNTANLDGCSSTCQIESGWTCTNNAAMTLSTCIPICGDGLRVAGESCDDGNISDNKGCKSDCSGVINGWHCSGGNPTTKDTCVEQCNDGYITVSEQCEDGNTVNLDGCSSTCQIESGWTCTNNVAMTLSTCIPICGDGVRVRGEACDDGNNSDNKGCKSDCSGSIDGWHCSGGNPTTKDICTEQCGDGYITISEQCEDGNSLNLDGCSSTCQIESGWSCVNNPSTTLSACNPICGDGIIVGPESCDDGNCCDEKGCNSGCNGTIRGWYCTSSANPASTCTTHLMDGIHVFGEEGCDDGNSIDQGDGCNNAGIVQDGYICVDDILQK